MRLPIPVRLTPDRAPWLFAGSTQAVFAALAAKGVRARVVGGAVRNALLGLPVADIDLATDAVPDVTMAAAAEAGLKVIPTGLAHGTVTVMSGQLPYEVTTLRRDVETDGRHARVAFTEDWVQDAQRRDFTINALYAEADGAIFDPLGTGVADLTRRCVRFIGDADLRIQEDFLRILRFFRFSAHYAEGAFDGAGFAAIVRNVDGLDRLSVERVWVELKKILLAPRTTDAVQAMIDTGVLVRTAGAVPQPRVFARRVAIERSRKWSSEPMQRLAALLVLHLDDAARLAARFKMSWDEHDGLRALLATPQIRKRTPVRDARARMFRERGDYIARVMHDWALSGDSVEDGMWQALADLPNTMPAPPFPLTGKDLVAAGVPPGPALGALLASLTQWWIDQDFPAEAVLRAELHRVTTEART